MGPYSVNVQRLRIGGIANIQKFNEGGINYLPSKVSHDEMILIIMLEHLVM